MTIDQLTFWLGAEADAALRAWAELEALRRREEQPDE